MNSALGWALAALFAVLAWQQYGWQGLTFAFTAIVFWLLLQFNRALRVMKNASQAPVGRVDSAVMLNAKLKPGMTLLQVLTLTECQTTPSASNGPTHPAPAWSSRWCAAAARVGNSGAWSLRPDRSFRVERRIRSHPLQAGGRRRNDQASMPSPSAIIA
jgi:uncharacterized protein (DUF58 family)